MEYKNIVVTPIEKIKPYPKNTKKHPQEQIDKLVKQLVQGFDQPIVVDKNYVIIKGHARHLAALQIGLKDVPVIVRDDLTKEQVKAVRIADNKLAESEWDFDILSQELKDLIDEVNLEDLGFNSEELEQLLGELEDDNDNDFNFNDINEGHTKEIDTNDFEFDCTCPKCGFQFTKTKK